MTKSRRKNKPRHVWSSAELAELKRTYPHISTHDIARSFGLSIFQIYAAAARYGLSKTEEYLNSPAACRLRRGDNVGWAHRFQKGSVPYNKGLRRPGWAPGRMRETQFKKGERHGAAAGNWKPIGTVLMDSDGYLRRKIAEGVGGFGNPKAWEFIHRRVWEDAHGPIPKGYRIWWKDGDHTNNSLDNLEILSGREHMARTTVHNLPPELRQVIQLTGALKRKIRNRANAKEQAVRSA